LGRRDFSFDRNSTANARYGSSAQLTKMGFTCKTAGCKNISKNIENDILGSENRLQFQKEVLRTHTSIENKW